MTHAFRWILGVTITSLAAGAWPAEAQYARYSPAPETAIGESYHIELAYGLWNPSPDVQISSGSLSIPGGGSTIDLVNDLGIQQKKLGEFRLVLKPARKHKFRIGYTPIKYSVDDAILHRDIVFRGKTFNVGLPVSAQATWKAWRFGYEYDFISAGGGFLGAVLEAKYTNADANLASPLATETASARAPIPAVGLIGRGYLARYVSATGEFTFFRLRNGDTDKYKGSYYDFDLYGTVNVTNYVGAQVGYRSLDVSYTVKADSGTMTLRGPYVMGVLRF
jgi:hypothetical protein